MTFVESIRVCLTKYAEFTGRASRAEFWWFALFVVLVASAFAYLSETLASVFLVAVLLPLLAADSVDYAIAARAGGGNCFCWFRWVASLSWGSCRPSRL